MKSKHFDTIIMDDLIQVIPTENTVKSKRIASQVERLLNYEVKRHALDIEKMLLWGTGYFKDPDYEAAKDLIREVVSGQDPEAPTP